MHACCDEIAPRYKCGWSLRYKVAIATEHEGYTVLQVMLLSDLCFNTPDQQAGQQQRAALFMAIKCIISSCSVVASACHSMKQLLSLAAATCIKYKTQCVLQHGKHPCISRDLDQNCCF